MPKIKTHKGAAKRIKLTGTGKMKRRKAFRSHLLEKKSPKRKQQYSKMHDVASADKKRVKKMLNI